MKKVWENHRLTNSMGGATFLGVLLIVIDRMFFTDMLLGPVGIIGVIALCLVGLLCLFIAFVLAVNWIFGGWD